MVDKHCHYSGSLTLDYIWEMYKKRKKMIKFNSELLAEKEILNNKSKLEQLITLKPSKNYKQNLYLFFEKYKIIQAITKSDNLIESKQLYKTGSENIVESYSTVNANGFELRIGPKNTYKKTKNRLINMVRGFETAEKKYNLKYQYAKLILSFIQREDGKFINLNKNILDDLNTLMTKYPNVKKRIIGIDFCGAEIKKDHPLIMDTINYFRKEYPNLEIMIHIGENLTKKNYHQTLDLIQKYIKLKINRISHGTILWLPNKYLPHSYDINEKRDNILHQIVNNKVELEICPTSNLRLTPLSSYKEIPLDKFNKIGLKYSINTDSKTIFQTTLQKEKENLS